MVMAKSIGIEQLTLFIPLARGGTLLYKFWTRKNIIDDDNFIQRIHECLLTKCSRELEEISLMDLLDMHGVYLTDFY